MNARDKKKSRRALLACIGAALLLNGCAVGPNYKRASAPVPAAFKEQPPEGWKEAQPADSELKGKWWEIYGDPELNALEEQVSISNQNVIAAEAQYRQARAAVGLARASLFPTSGATMTITGSHTGISARNFAVSGTRASYSLPLDVSYAPDVWGSVRRGVTASVATAQASAAQLENVRLLYQSDLALDYFQLHTIDTEQDLLTRTIASYDQYLKLTRDRFAAGVASALDVAQAESQLSSAQAQSIDLNVQRAALEHAIAILMGRPPAEVTIQPALLKAPPPPVPLSVPSTLLERRPDVAAAERNVAAANEQIGIAKAAFFPTVMLGGSLGFQTSDFAKWISMPSRFWSIGPNVAETLFDAGRRRSRVAQTEAAYDTLVADYRQTVLNSFQQIEDNLAALRYLDEEAIAVQNSVAAAERSLDLSTLQYKAGTTSYLQVIIAQATALQAERAAVQVLGRRLAASVLLIEALGGGWNTFQLPTRQQITAVIP